MAELSRAAIRRLPAGDARALAARPEGVNASFDGPLAGCVVLELILGQLEANEMLERGIRDGSPYRRIG